MTDHLTAALIRLKCLRQFDKMMSPDLDRATALALLGHVESFERRERDLLEANNRYLERARRVEAGVLTSEDGEFSCTTDHAVEVAHMLNLLGCAMLRGSLGTWDIAEYMRDYLDGNADAEETIRELRSC